MANQFLECDMKICSLRPSDPAGNNSSTMKSVAHQIIIVSNDYTAYTHPLYIWSSIRMNTKRICLKIHYILYKHTYLLLCGTPIV